MTSNPFIPLFHKADESELIFLNDDLEQTFTRIQLNKMARMWNTGAGLYDLAIEYDCDVDEIFLALFHLARKSRLKRSFMNEIIHWRSKV